MRTPNMANRFSNRGAAIEQAARKLLATSRFDAIKVEHIVDLAEISKPVFYEHFASKDALGVRLLQKALREALEKLTTLRAARSGVDALRAVIEWAMEQHFGSGYAGFARLISCIEDTSVRIAERRWLQALEQLIARDQATRLTRSRVPPPVVVATLYSILKDADLDRALIEGSMDLASLKRGVTQLLLR